MEDKRKEREREESARAKVLQFPAVGSRAPRPIAERAVLQDVYETREGPAISRDGRSHQTAETPLGFEVGAGEPSESLQSVPPEKAESGTEIILAEREREILEHSLGLYRGRERLAYRNYFCTDKNGLDYEAIQSLIRKGLMIEGVTDNRAFGGMTFFHVTTNGMLAVGPFEWKKGCE